MSGPMCDACTSPAVWGIDGKLSGKPMMFYACHFHVQRFQ